MQTMNLYKYTRPDGGITVSPIKPDTEYTLMYRLIADDGKEISNDNENWTCCADVDNPEGWVEREIQ